MGPIDKDKLLMILLFNRLGAHYTCLQTLINDMFTSGSTTSADVCSRLLLKEQIINDNANVLLPTALAAVIPKQPRPVCANCKRPSHCTEFCISPSSQMAEKTIEEAQAAQDAMCNTQKPGGTGRTRGNRTATPAPSQPENVNTNNTNAKTLTMNSQCYMLVTPSVLRHGRDILPTRDKSTTGNVALRF